MSKATWKQIVWEPAWEQETDEWNEMVRNKASLIVLKSISVGLSYPVWWQLSDLGIISFIS